MNKIPSEVSEEANDLSPIDMSNRKRLCQVAIHFQQAMAHLLICDPLIYSSLLTKENELPTLFELKVVLQGKESQLPDAPYLSYVSGILFALNCLDRDTGSLLYRHLFIRREKDQWQESFSHSAFYRVSNKAIDMFFQILDGSDFDFCWKKEAVNDNSSERT